MTVQKAITLAVITVIYIVSSGITSLAQDQQRNEPAVASDASRASDTVARSLARQLQLKQRSDDPEVRRNASKLRVGDVLPADFNSGDQKRIEEAIDVLRLSMKDNGAWCRNYLLERWLQPLLKLHQFALIEEIIAEAFNDPRSYDDTKGMIATQLAKLKYLIAAGKTDEAVVAAKVYFNVCKIDESEDAIDMLEEALRSSEKLGGTELAERFRKQQEDGMVAALPNIPGKDVSDKPESVLKAIKCDASVYQAKLKTIDLLPATFATLTAKGNLLLFADMAEEASPFFEQSLQVAKTKAEKTAALSNLARAVRDKAGIVAPAKDFIGTANK